jgi:hypothetical protein
MGSRRVVPTEFEGRGIIDKVRAILMVEFETVSSLPSDALKRGIDELKAGIEGSRLKLPREMRRGSPRVHLLSCHVAEEPDENLEWLRCARDRHGNSRDEIRR